MTENIEIVEARMRPGQYSERGFLGANESLYQVIEKDAEAINSLGLTHERIADELERVISAAKDFMLTPEGRHPVRMQFEPALGQFERVPLIEMEQLPEKDDGYLMGELQVWINAYRGFQTCPWQCKIEPNWSDYDFLILNRETGEAVTGPGLIIHLIREHQFFEGDETPYRVHPDRLAQVLGMI